MHRLSTTFVLGYHGCDRQVAERLLSGTPFEPSHNEYDWLGSGTYFWEANPRRGLEFISEVQVRRRGSAAPVHRPYVIGAVIDLGLCLDLMSSAGTAPLKPVHDSFVDLCRKAGKPVPRNTGGADLLRRNLDCAVINHLHELRESSGQPPFDTVRGVFIEGGRIYEDSGFFQKSHIQICVRRQACIKGVFRVPHGELWPAGPPDGGVANR